MHTRTFKDSGEIILTNSTEILSNKIYVFEIDERFKPYEKISIINNSIEDISVTSNYKNNFSFIVPSGNQRILDIVAEDIRIKNKGLTTISANQINLNIRHTGEREKDKIKEKLQIVSQIAMLKNLF